MFFIFFCEYSPAIFQGCHTSFLLVFSEYLSTIFRDMSRCQKGDVVISITDFTQTWYDDDIGITKSSTDQPSRD